MNYFEPDALSHLEEDDLAARERAADIHNRELEEKESPTGDEDEGPWKREREHIEQLRKEEESQSS